MWIDEKESTQGFTGVLFVDSNYFYHLQKDTLGWFIDPKKLKDWVSSRVNLIDRRYYTSYGSLQQTQPFLEALGHIGYRVVNKEPKKVFDNAPRATYAIDVAIDALTMLDFYDVFVLVSGDGEYESLIKDLQSKGKLVILMGSPNGVSKHLRALVGGNFIDMSLIKNEILKEKQD